MFSLDYGCEGIVFVRIIQENYIDNHNEITFIVELDFSRESNKIFNKMNV